MEDNDSISISTRTSFSNNHIRSAAFLCREAYKIEQNYNFEFDDDIISMHKAYVTGAMLSSVFFLEALINELFSDIGDNVFWMRQDELSPEISKLMATMWNNGIPRTASYSILEKYQVALMLNNKDLFAKGEQPYQDVNYLVLLRNALVHFEPEWVKLSLSDDFNEQKDLHKYEKMLKGKFELNPLALGNAFYPERCLSHGGAEWAIKSCVKFTDKFYSKMNLAIPYEFIRSKLSTK